jgi:hypothetical protein
MDIRVINLKEKADLIHELHFFTNSLPSSTTTSSTWLKRSGSSSDFTTMIRMNCSHQHNTVWVKVLLWGLQQNNK